MLIYHFTRRLKGRMREEREVELMDLKSCFSSVGSGCGIGGCPMRESTASTPKINI